MAYPNVKPPPGAGAAAIGSTGYRKPQNPAQDIGRYTPGQGPHPADHLLAVARSIFGPDDGTVALFLGGRVEVYLTGPYAGTVDDSLTDWTGPIGAIEAGRPDAQIEWVYRDVREGRRYG